MNDYCNFLLDGVKYKFKHIATINNTPTLSETNFLFLYNSFLANSVRHICCIECIKNNAANIVPNICNGFGITSSSSKGVGGCEGSAVGEDINVKKKTNASKC